MANLTEIVKKLRDERNRVARELSRLDGAIAALGALSNAPATAKAGKAKPRRKLSAAARKKIADAQRARWAKLKKQQKAA